MDSTKPSNNYRVCIIFNVKAKDDFEAYESVKNWMEATEPFNDSHYDIEVN